MVSNKTKDRRAADNSVYVAIAGEVVNRKSVLPRNFVLNGQESASNPLLHIHATVIGHFKNTTLTNNTKYELRENIRKN